MSPQKGLYLIPIGELMRETGQNLSIGDLWNPNASTQMTPQKNYKVYSI